MTAPYEPPLSPRQREVLVLKAGGLTDAQIAQKLAVTPHTVSEILTRAYRKLGVKRAMPAVVIALRTGRITLDEIDIHSDSTTQQTA